MIDLFVMRHGQSVGDIENRFEGRADFPLTDLGRKQARLAATWFSTRYTVDRLLASPLKRAAETASIMSQALGVPVEFHDELMEANTGELGGMLRSEGAKRFAHLFATRAELAPYQSFPGGE